MATAFRTYEDIGTMNTKTWSLFGNADAELTEQLKLTVGLRYTEDKQDYVGCSRDYKGSMLPNVNVVNRFLFSAGGTLRSEEHTSELQSLMRISYAVFCLQKKQYSTQ